MEHHEPQFRGVWVPADVMSMQAEGVIKAPDVVLLAIIDSLVAPDVGCYASNDYLARRMSKHPRSIQERIAKLKGLGLIKEVEGPKGSKRRHIETAWSRALPQRAKGDEKTTPGVTKRPPPILRERDKTLSGPTATDEAEGFGLVGDTKGTATPFDNELATQLLEACRGHLGTSHPICRRARLSAWANHLRLLRTVDKITERRIGRVMDWYVTHIGQEFVPEAYAGESFRKKFFKIEGQYKRDVVGTVEVGEAAARIATRLQGVGWPKGSTEAVPAAVQATLNSYEAWMAGRDSIISKLGTDDLSEDYGAERKRLLKLGGHLARVMPAPEHFAQAWMTAVHSRVSNWDGWSGELGPFVFRPEIKRFRAMGRGWAKEFAHDPDRWDRFVEVMQKENNE